MSTCNNLKILQVCVLLVLSLTINAQEFKFGKVSKKELLEKSYPLDSSANAAVLYESKKIHYVYNQSEKWFQLETEVFRRIKLYNKQGFIHGTDRTYLYKNNVSEEVVSGLKGVTYNLENNKIVKTKLKKDGVFKNEFSEDYNQHQFTMPVLKEGSVIEYSYKIVSPFVYNIDRIYLQERIPIKKLAVKIEFPEYFNFKKFTTGYLPINLKETFSNGDFVYMPDPKTPDMLKQGLGVTGKRTKRKQSIIDYKINVNTILSSDVPAFNIEAYSGNAKNYISSIVYELQYTKFGDNIKNYATTWEDIIKTIYSRAGFGEELKKSNYYKEDLNQLLMGISDPVKKTVLIYEFLKKKMTWNSRHSVYTRNGVKKAYKEGVGNVAEINIMLTSMLSSVGIDANPVLISTKDRVASLYPTLDGFNYVITRVRFSDGNMMYLDATDKYGEPNILPDRVLHGAARIISDNKTSQSLNLRPKKPSESISRVQYQIDTHGLIKGKANLYNMGYLAHRFRVRQGEESLETQEKRVKQKYEISDLEQYDVKGIKDIGKPVNERFEFSLEDQVEVIDNEMFFSPLLFLKYKENIFKLKKRVYPIDFGYGYINTISVNIKIPEGYQIVETPKEAVVQLPDNMGSFVYRLKINGDSIQVSVAETLNESIILADKYPVIKEFYNQIIQKENEQVVLKKI